MKAPALATVVVLSILLPMSTADLSTLAEQLSMNQTWSAPQPAGVNADSSLVASSISSDWGVASSSFYGGNSNVQFVQDPFNSTSSVPVLQVFYPQGSYAPSQNKGKRGGGTEFYATPFGNQTFDRALLSYKVGFPADFPWQLGGKLPGIYGGAPGEGCSGGALSNGTNCFSMRMMWREKGAGEAYAYIPSPSDYCQQQDFVCHDKYGLSISRGNVQFTAGTWTAIDLYIQLNRPGSKDGVVSVWVNGYLVINTTNLVYHNTNMVLIQSLMFSTFFGGSSQSYAAPTDTYTYFKDVQFSVGAPMTPSSASPSCVGIAWVFVLTAVVALVLGA
ncbi:polysaccharide lyase family 14 protein [Jimgerdemannia flammicorona]|uniref:Polysaccharide lyase family 14 protein n=2 Tax=Jimgerdemannia flammicorona TaxID=994334 RepID=A0A433A0D6_9FUNG|nr:polysaccharide lyase family 14 protein [Jimgerdemannia flammicorona]RUS28135.1 polysaccharide lyase family 14 protein [Jimgerdemannia flammicorona]